MKILLIVSIFFTVLSGVISAGFLIKKNKLFGIISLVIFLISVGISSYLTYQTQIELENFKKYSNISRLGIDGLEISPGHGLSSNDLLYKTLEGTYKSVENKIYYQCGKENENKYLQAIEINTDFPFSYYALALCMHDKGDERWVDYAEKAISIFKITIKIGGHKLEHEEALKELKKYLYKLKSI